MKIVLIGIAILIIGGLFVLQDFGSLDPEPEQPVIKRAVEKEPEPASIKQVEREPKPSQSTQPSTIQPQSEPKPSCDSSYPDVCIPPRPPDLDCDEISYSNFKVRQPDPHGFDRDQDGIGCEVGSPSEPVQSNQESSCDSSYPDVCIPQYPPDLDCGEISHKNFKVLAPDPHGFDGDKDGIGCES